MHPNAAIGSCVLMECGLKGQSHQAGCIPAVWRVQLSSKGTVSTRRYASSCETVQLLSGMTDSGRSEQPEEQAVGLTAQVGQKKITFPVEDYAGGRLMLG